MTKSAFVSSSQSTKNRRSGLTAFSVFGLLSLFLLIAGCGSSANPGGTSKTLTGLAVTPATANVAAGATRQFTATATYNDGSTANVTTAVTWTAKDSSIAT